MSGHSLGGMIAPDLGARTIAVRGVGHLSMPHNARIAFQISTALRELDQGRTAKSGSTG